jgi:hypothetical protein
LAGTRGVLNDALSIYFPDPAADGVCLFFASTTEGNRSVLMPRTRHQREVPDDLATSVKYS